MLLYTVWEVSLVILCPVQVHSMLEVILLTLLWLDMVLRFLWFRPRYFFTHKRTLALVSVWIPYTSDRR